MSAPNLVGGPTQTPPMAVRMKAICGGVPVRSKRGSVSKGSVFTFFRAISFTMDKPISATPLPHPMDESLPPWAEGAVFTKRAAAGAGLEWTSEADIVDQIRLCTSQELGGLQWLQAPGMVVAQVDSLGMLQHAIELRLRERDRTPLFVVALPRSLSFSPDLVTALCTMGISVSHSRGSSALESAIQELCRLLIAGEQGVDNFRRFAKSLASSGE